MNDRTDFFGFINAEQRTADLDAFIERQFEHRFAPPACKGCLRELPKSMLAGGICDKCSENEELFEDVK